MFSCFGSISLKTFLQCYQCYCEIPKIRIKISATEQFLQHQMSALQCRFTARNDVITSYYGGIWRHNFLSQQDMTSSLPVTHLLSISSSPSSEHPFISWFGVHLTLSPSGPWCNDRYPANFSTSSFCVKQNLFCWMLGLHAVMSCFLHILADEPNRLAAKPLPILCFW